MTLKDYMQNKNLTVASMAVLLGCSEGAVRKWCYGERRPRQVQIQRLHVVTDGQVTANDFYAVEDDHEQESAA